MIKFFHKENHFFVKNERGKEVYGIRYSLYVKKGLISQGSPVN